MSVQTIHDQLLASGMTEEGVDGLMGNMRGESAMRSNNVEDRCPIADADYVALVDNDPSYDFVTDNGAHYGFGLCQWTEKKRKAKLLAYAKMQGCSIADEDMQVRFCILEMKSDFPQVWAVLTSSHDLRQCTEIVLNIYENPMVKNLGVRLQYAQAFYDQFSAGTPQVSTVDTISVPSDDAPLPAYPWKPDLAVMLLQALMRYDGYWDGEIDGYKSDEFRDAVVDYAEAVAEC
jgi:hypothetical protein